MILICSGFFFLIFSPIIILSIPVLLWNLGRLTYIFPFHMIKLSSLARKTLSSIILLNLKNPHIFLSYPSSNGSPLLPPFHTPRRLHASPSLSGNFEEETGCFLGLMKVFWSYVLSSFHIPFKNVFTLVSFNP